MGRYVLLLLAVLVLTQKCCCQRTLSSGVGVNKAKDKKEIAEFLDCMLEDVITCSAENKMWKEILPYIYSTKCSSCTGEQLKIFNEANTAIKAYYPERYEMFLKKMNEDVIKIMANNFD